MKYKLHFKALLATLTIALSILGLTLLLTLYPKVILSISLIVLLYSTYSIFLMVFDKKK